MTTTKINYTQTEKNDKELQKLLCRYPLLKKIIDWKKTVRVFKKK